MKKTQQAWTQDKQVFKVLGVNRPKRKNKELEREREKPVEQNLAKYLN